MVNQTDMAIVTTFSICGRDRARNRGWRARKACPDVNLDVEQGKVSDWSEAGTAPVA